MPPIRRLTAPLLLAGILLAAAGCGSKAGSAQAATLPSATTAQPSPTGQPGSTGGGQPATTTTKGTATTSTTSDWPSPEDCTTYNPSALTVQFANGVYTVTNGSILVIRVYGQQGDNTGQKALALAQHYKRHCYIGRHNTMPAPGPFIMDYWRDSSGLNPTIPDQENDCSGYNRNNLTVEDMGNGDGWRVKDHDHPLQLFANETDARNGKLVIQKYSQACSIGDGDNDQDVVSYWL
jgi:hypothetical protein